MNTLLAQADNGKIVRMKYTNYKGATAIRTIQPIELLFTHNVWHPQEQWMIKALDLDKGEIRTFALKDCDFTFQDVTSNVTDIVED